MADDVKRLVLSDTDKKIAGVCGGLANHLSVDSTLIRLIFVFLVLWGGGGLLFYLIAWAVMPRANALPPVG